MSIKPAKPSECYEQDDPRTALDSYERFSAWWLTWRLERSLSVSKEQEAQLRRLEEKDLVLTRGREALAHEACPGTNSFKKIVDEAIRRADEVLIVHPDPVRSDDEARRDGFLEMWDTLSDEIAARWGTDVMFKGRLK